MVIMASGITHGRVSTTTTVTEELCEMAAILQIIGCLRHAVLVYGVLFLYMTSCYDQLAPVKSSYLLTSIV